MLALLAGALETLPFLNPSFPRASMAAISCTHCGADLTAPERAYCRVSFRASGEGPPKICFKYHFEQADNFTILCNSCKR